MPIPASASSTAGPCRRAWAGLHPCSESHVPARLRQPRRDRQSPRLPSRGRPNGRELYGRTRCENGRISAAFLDICDAMRTQSGGDGGIRTLGTDVSVRRFSKPLVSATHPRLRIAAARARYSEGFWGRQAPCREFARRVGNRFTAKRTRIIAGSLRRGQRWVLLANKRAAAGIAGRRTGTGHGPWGFRNLRAAPRWRGQSRWH